MGWSGRHKAKKIVYGYRSPHFKELPDSVEYGFFDSPQEDGVSIWKDHSHDLLKGIIIWYCLAFVNQLLGVAVIPIAVIVTVLFDLLNPTVIRKSFSIFCCSQTIVERIVMAIRKLLDIPLMIVYNLNGDTWVDLLEICLKQNYFLVTWWLDCACNAQLYYRRDRAVFVFARAGRAKKISELSGVEGPDEETQARREISMTMVEDFRRIKRDLVALEFLKECHKDGADLNWPDPYGNTVLSVAVQRCYVQCANWLIDNQDVDPNRQDHYNGNTGMHKLVQRISKRGDESAAAMFRLLLNNSRSDFSILNFHGDGGTIKKMIRKERGRTPYMTLRNPDKFPACATALKPKPSFQQLEKLLKAKNKSARQKCSDIYKLISKKYSGDKSLHHLRVMDMLFCTNEGTQEGLEARREFIFHNFLNQVLLLSTQEVSQDEKLTHDDVKLLRWMYYQTAGPPGTTKEEARRTYIEEFEKLLDDAEGSIEKRYGQVYKSLQSEEGADEFFAIGRELYYTGKNQALKHSTFQRLPDFIRNQNGIQAVRDLKAVGAIQNAGEFCDLLQGRHRLFGDQPIIRLFLGDPNNTGKILRCINSQKTRCFKGDSTLWRSLLLIWQICLQEKIMEEFEERMSAIAEKVEGVSFKRAPGVKGFVRSYEKTVTYGEDFTEGVDASMRVIDGLRCSFVVDSISQNLQVGKLIEETFGVARTKNMHQRGNVGYADRKYNVVFASNMNLEGVTKVKGVESPIQMICEIQVLLKEYYAIKADGHLLYEFQRQPVQKAPLNLRSTTRDAKNCVCAFAKFWILVCVALVIFLILSKRAGCYVSNCIPTCQVSNYPRCESCDIGWGCDGYFLQWKTVECYYIENDWDPIDCFCSHSGNTDQCNHFDYNETRTYPPTSSPTPFPT